MTRYFGSKPTMYQHKVNSLPGALGPASSAMWKNTYKMTGPAYSLASAPLYYAPTKGFYVTSADVPAANYSVDFSNFGFGYKRRSRRGSRRSRRGSRSRRRSRKGSRRSRKRSRRSRKGSRRSRRREPLIPKGPGREEQNRRFLSKKLKGFKYPNGYILVGYNADKGGKNRGLYFKKRGSGKKLQYVVINGGEGGRGKKTIYKLKKGDRYWDKIRNL
jgi:hypothetical protein